MISTAVIVGEIRATDWASSGGNPSACGRRRGGEEFRTSPEGFVAVAAVLIGGSTPLWAV